MTRIWLNHWFSTAYNIIQMIREKNPDFIFVGSNENADSPIKKVCDEWYQEPVLKGRAYVDFCLEFCREHHIDLFMPRREMVAVSKYKALFRNNGIQVMVDDYDLVSVLNDKAQTYERFAAKGIGKIPGYHIVTTPGQFAAAYEELLTRYDAVCFKFVNDEGGKSYRLIDNSRCGYEALYKKMTTRMTYDAALEALSERESFSPLMVMPYLPDEEMSVDCLRTAYGLIAIPRIKDYSRIERICFDTDLLETCEQVLEEFPLEQPCNIQFKYLKGTPYLLEVNTRMSGGIQMSCAATGVNIPDLAVNKLLGIHKPWHMEKRECRVTHVEVPIVL